MSFECPECGFKNNEIQSGQQIQEKGLNITVSSHFESNAVLKILQAVSSKINAALHWLPKLMQLRVNWHMYGFQVITYMCLVHGHYGDPRCTLFKHASFPSPFRCYRGR